VSVRIYIEGGGPHKGKNAAIKCRQALHVFFEKFMDVGKVHPIACGGGREAFDDFSHALADPKHAGKEIFLLVDSETSVAAGTTAKQHLRHVNKWIFSDSVSEDRVHMMVQCMEAWFMADKDAVARYYGSEFPVGSLPGNPNIEAIDKKDILNALQHAAKNTSKGGYNKGSDAFAILGLINADRVCAAFARAARLRNCLLSAGA